MDAFRVHSIYFLCVLLYMNTHTYVHLYLYTPICIVTTLLSKCVDNSLQQLLMLLSKVGSETSTSFCGLIHCCCCLIILFLTKFIWISSFIYLMYDMSLYLPPACLIFVLVLFLCGRVRVFTKLHLIKMHFLHKLQKCNK